MDLSSIQFEHTTPELGESFTTHSIRAYTTTPNPVTGRDVETTLGTMLWSGRHGIRNIGVGEQHQRQGVATAMWEEGHRMAAENARVPQPKHSKERTTAGDAWARSVGGRLPRKVTFMASFGQERPA